MPTAFLKISTALCAAVWIAGCQIADQSGKKRPRNTLPPTQKEDDGTCWARVVTPAIYEQVMGEVQVVQAELAPDGSVLRPPIYRKAPVPRLVRPRGVIKFQAPCPEQMTPEFISSVQRALEARGYFTGTISGEMDPATTAAVRKYQKERGLESAQISLETARALGLIAVDRSTL
jgi:hypothetical protein